MNKTCVSFGFGHRGHINAISRKNRRRALRSSLPSVAYECGLVAKHSHFSTQRALVNICMLIITNEYSLESKGYSIGENTTTTPCLYLQYPNHSSSTRSPTALRTDAVLLCNTINTSSCLLYTSPSPRD